MSDEPEAPLPAPRRRTDPEVRKERVKLIASGLNAVGVAFVIGSLVAPLIDPTRAFDLSRMALGSLGGMSLVVAAIVVLRYIKPPEG